MTKIQMPEPTAEIRIVSNVTIFDLTPVGKQQGLSVGQKFITTAQAEAYADARVREALEEAAKILDNESERYEQKAQEIDPDEVPHMRSTAWRLSVCARDIRALIPKEVMPLAGTVNTD